MIVHQTLVTLSLLVQLWVTPPPFRVAVLPIDLNDVSNQPVSLDLRARLERLTEALSTRLATACGYTIVGSPAERSGKARRGGRPYRSSRG